MEAESRFVVAGVGEGGNGVTANVSRCLEGERGSHEKLVELEHGDGFTSLRMY